MKKYSVGVGIVVLLLIVGFLIRQDGTKPDSAVKQVKGSYVALGDSVAAGAGLPDDSDSSACGRTNQAYPNLVATKTHYKLKNIACGGATIPGGISGNQNVNNLQVAPQIEQLFAQPKPDLITLTIGANDAHWTDVIEKCYINECGSAADTVALQTALAGISTNLQDILNQISGHYKGSVPHLIVTGYYEVFPSGITTCPDLTSITPAELAWGRQMQKSISETIKATVAGHDFARFAPVDFAGHELCTSDPWVQGLGDPAPYHPTAAGQQEIARQIESARKDFK